MLSLCSGSLLLWVTLSYDGSLLRLFFLTPKDMGSWLRSALLLSFLPLESGLEKFSPLRAAPGGEDDESDCKENPERERWGGVGEESLPNLT